MSVFFSISRNGSKTCSLNSVHLHSIYNPELEAERFVSNLKTQFNPLCVIIIEPALSYCIKPLRIRFPHAQLCAIRLLKDFTAYDKNWDKVIYYQTELLESFSEYLFELLGEENLCSSLVCIWPGSGQILSVPITSVLHCIKNAISKSSSVLRTRSYFSSKWICNALFFSLYIQNQSLIYPGNSPVVIAASGPSLLSSLSQIKNNRTSFFLIAVSSALYTLLYHGITPDLCLTTDGGFWASFHLHSPGLISNTIPFAITSEANCPGEILSSKKIIPLSYSDGPESAFFSPCGIKTIPVLRNGTVSGTALSLALKISTGPVFFCGLDLASSSEYQHAEPNTLDIYNQNFDNRIKPLENRLTTARFSSIDSLQIYRSWFKSLNFAADTKVYRLSNNYNYHFSLDPIQDINFNSAAFTLNPDAIFPKIVQSSPLMKLNKRRSLLSSIINSTKDNDCWDPIVCPYESMMLKRASNTFDRNEALKKRDEKRKIIFKKMERFIHG